ncbi:uncharacterized protein ARB_00573 [Trichophyton benhamiae CBS 112371]|uniref:Uncharacterized protein n=1 Tax=Arthroderma benhamiae (strain ATCC MYA-4681 / CBS 112371) TaxID=663331 RepID=D4AWK7_ARTBC|nr:uncharacterized protein ARB_00573 [Trichophyton benhamiae CBS 112371]EFE32388.1 hypothetical protein ARB_00573 [Trichophyton benhamiae CBS 112371]
MRLVYNGVQGGREECSFGAGDGSKRARQSTAEEEEKKEEEQQPRRRRRREEEKKKKKKNLQKRKGKDGAG